MKARKDYKCTLCGLKIPRGEDYFYQRITPWDHPDNEIFSDFRAHKECEKLWQEIGESWDYLFPDPADFRDELTYFKQKEDKND